MRLIRELDHDQEELPTAATAPEMSPFGDIPRPIWTAFLSIWGVVFGIFVVVFATDGPATLAVLTAAFFALMTLGLPAMLCSQSRPAPRPWPPVIQTRTGPLSTRAAATQILLIPAGAAFGLVLFVLLAM